jgi:phosphoenolpyruvate-protein phosphotransferase (PTS system enzyme I)
MHKTSTPKRLELAGTSIAPGFVLGQAHLLRQISLEALEKNLFPVSDPDAEIQRLERAFAQTRSQLEQLQSQVRAGNGHDLAGILEAQLALLEDAAFLEKIRETIRSQAVNTEYLIANEIRRIEKDFRNLKDEVMRSRFLDVQDVHHRLLRNLLEIEHVRTNPFRRLTAPVVLVADRMLPSDIALLDLDKILGLVIEEGSRVSHVAIIAKSLGIPALTSVPHASALVRSGDTVLLNADTGKAIVHPDADDLAWYEKSHKQRPATARAGRKPGGETAPCQTSDGKQVTLEANVGSLREVEEALAAGADGIGLLRSEFFYMSCQEMPDVDAETAFYRDALRAMRKRPVTIRLLDIGADKSLSYLQLPKEENPQLGIRGVRLLLRTPDLLHRHLLSILRASDSGPVRLLLPFIATMNDLDRILAATQELCQQERIPRARFHVGIMVEVPAVALDTDPFLAKVDFLSIGTNDLVQYMFAASREDSHLEEYRLAHHPAILRLIHGVADAAKAHGKPVSVCGEMASDPSMALLLVGLGIRTLSLQASALHPVRASIQKQTLPALEKLAREALEMDQAEQVLDLLKKLHTT